MLLKLHITGKRNSFQHFVVFATTPLDGKIRQCTPDNAPGGGAACFLRSSDTLMHAKIIFQNLDIQPWAPGPWAEIYYWALGRNFYQTWDLNLNQTWAARSYGTTAERF